MVGLAGCSSFLGGGSDGEASGQDFGPETLQSENLSDKVIDPRSEDSYTVDVSLSYANNTTERTLIGVSLNINQSSERGLQEFTSAFGNASTYTKGDVTYRKSTSPFSNETRYQKATAPYDGEIDSVLNQSNPGNATEDSTTFNESVQLEKNGYEQFNGERVAVYSANVSGDVLNQSATATVEADRGEVTAYMNSDGEIVRYEVVSFGTNTESGEQVRATLLFEVTDVGSTTVEEPEWLDEAKQQTNEEQMN